MPTTTLISATKNIKHPYGMLQAPHPQPGVTVPLFLDWQLLAMNFGNRLAALRKERSSILLMSDAKRYTSKAAA